MKTYGQWVATLGVMALFLVGCVMGAPEEGEFMEEPGSLEGLPSDFLTPTGHFNSPNSSDDDDQKPANLGKSDDARRPSETDEDGPEGLYEDPTQKSQCPNEEEFEGDELPGQECMPADRGNGHGSPQPLDPTDPEEEDSDSESDDEG